MKKTKMEYPELKNKSYLENGFNLRRLTIGLAVILLVVYGLFNARNLILGPRIEILNPAVKEIEVYQNNITIRGKVSNTVFISLNERPIFVDPDGFFEEKLLLIEGSNIIEVKARDRFKKEVLEQMKVYYKKISSSTELSLLKN